MTVPRLLVANAADRLWRLPGKRQAAAATKARAVLDRRDSLRAAAIVAATKNAVAERLAA